MYIRSSTNLRRLCDKAASTARMALDVEFIREETYVPQLALIQMAVEDVCAIIDPLAVDDLTPLRDLLDSPDVLKVLHAPAQDLEILYWHLGRLPVHLFDTQTAAALVGLGEQLSYGHLVKRLLHMTLPKGESYSKWMQRPLTPAQIAYALDDVRYLLPLHELLTTRLEEMGRAAWAREEFRKFENPERYGRDPGALFRRIRRGRTLGPEGLAILRELVVWRDQEAQQRDKPPGSVLRDDALADLARKAPRTLHELTHLRSLPRREFDRSGPALVAAIQRGMAVAEDERPQPIRRPRLSRTEELIVKFLDTYLKALCQQKNLAASYVAKRADLECLVSAYRHGKLASHGGGPLLEGWRRPLVGEELLAVLEGRVSLYIDSATGQVEKSLRQP
jgi:ribonuclease D